MTSLTVLARLPTARLVRLRRSWLPIFGWSLLAVGSALVARAAQDASGADRVLRGTFALVILPLLSYGIVSSTLGSVGLRRSVRGLVALGAPPWRAACASIVVAMAASAVVCAAVAMLVCVIAHGETDAPLGRDLPMTFGVALTGGAAYAAYFCAGSAIGKGAMRGVFLVLDYLLGASAGFGALFTPRGHVTSLLGGPACFELSRRASSVFLVVLTLAFFLFAIRWTARRS